MDRLNAWLAACVFIVTCQAAAGDDGAEPVRAGTPSERILHAPEDRESFDFMVFGDRTGGPREGVEVLRDAVTMANRMDVDLVLTVGDLVEGYNLPQTWRSQMSEYTSVMDGLKMPWYAVPGNHDVYARPERPKGNMDLYTKYFGPLYYSFDYKWAHFIVLFSDEALSFGNPPVDQNFSAEQMAWLREDLASTEAEMVFVFLHHPRWTKRYAGCNWDDVHRMFVADGRAVTVFAGHIHVYRDDGQRDNVHYYALATTGGHLGKFTETAALHHVNFVRVRPNRTTVAVLPVGSVRGGDFVLGAEVDAMNSLAQGTWVSLRGKAAIGVKAGAKSSLSATLKNPTDRALRVSAEVAGPKGWRFEYEKIDLELPAGETVSLKVRAAAPALGAAEPVIQVRAEARFPLRSGLVQPIEVSVRVPVDLVDAAAVAEAVPERNGVLVLDGSSAVRVAVREQPGRYTLECWVRGEAPKGRAALLAKTERSAYGIFWSDRRGGATLPTGFVGTAEGYLSLPASSGWAWNQWTHVALVFDGREARFFVNGRLSAKQATTAAATHNRLPLYVGADPNPRGRANSFFTGQIDEVRLSDVARYVAPFQPEHVFQRDANTLLLLHFDRPFGGAFPDDSGTDHHGWAVGKPGIERAER